MRKPTAQAQSAYTQHELEPEFVAWRNFGCWSAYGIASSAQPRPLTIVGDAVFYLQLPQAWVTQELFTDEGMDDGTVCFDGKA